MIEADDVPQQELAAVLGLEPAAFRKRLSRARRALSELLREEEA
jgi:DNA-directed RNA polymerase specialized sigma24 family protein